MSVSRVMTSYSAQRFRVGTIKAIVYILLAGFIPINVVMSAPAAQAAGTITFNANFGATPATTTQVVSGASANLNANTFVRPGYTFIGWATTQNNWSVTTGVGSFGALIADQTPNYVVAANTTLYAQWNWDFNATTQLTNLSSGVITTAATQGTSTAARGTPGLVQVNTNQQGIYLGVNSANNYAVGTTDLVTQAFDKDRKSVV